MYFSDLGIGNACPSTVLSFFFKRQSEQLPQLKDTACRPQAPAHCQSQNMLRQQRRKPGRWRKGAEAPGQQHKTKEQKSAGFGKLVPQCKGSGGSRLDAPVLGHPGTAGPDGVGTHQDCTRHRQEGAAAGPSAATRAPRMCGALPRQRRLQATPARARSARGLRARPCCRPGAPGAPPWPGRLPSLRPRLHPP